jgi:hypothetical protein
MQIEWKGRAFFKCSKLWKIFDSLAVSSFPVEGHFIELPKKCKSFIPLRVICIKRKEQHIPM